MRLQQKVVLVTAATRGIGLACVKACAKEGAQVYLAARDLATTSAPLIPAGIWTLPTPIPRCFWIPSPSTCAAFSAPDRLRHDIWHDRAAAVLSISLR